MQADAAARGNLPEIIRNAGAAGCKDIHLDDFNLSNGGKDLISDATLMLAFGRRYGLIGRNGTGESIECLLPSAPSGPWAALLSPRPQWNRCEDWVLSGNRRC